MKCNIWIIYITDNSKSIVINLISLPSFSPDNERDPYQNIFSNKVKNSVYTIFTHIHLHTHTDIHTIQLKTYHYLVSIQNYNIMMPTYFPPTVCFAILQHSSTTASDSNVMKQKARLCPFTLSYGRSISSI